MGFYLNKTSVITFIVCYHVFTIEVFRMTANHAANSLFEDAMTKWKSHGLNCSQMPPRPHTKRRSGGRWRERPYNAFLTNMWRDKPMYRFLLVGDHNTGKSTIFSRFLGKDATNMEAGNGTQQFHFGSRHLRTPSSGLDVVLECWDTPGYADEHQLKLSYEVMDAVVFVYDVNSEATFKNIFRRFEVTRELRETKARLYLVGNKLDLKRRQSSDDAVVSSQRAKWKANKHAMRVMELSAFSDHGVERLFEEITKDFFERVKASNDCYTDSA